MDKQNFSPFYRTLSPLGAGAQKEAGQFSRMGRNSVHPLVLPSVCLSIHPKGSEGQLKGSEGQLMGSEGQLEQCEGQLEGL